MQILVPKTWCCTHDCLSIKQSVATLVPQFIKKKNNNNNNVTIVVGQGQGLSVIPYERCFIEFKFNPRASFILHCSAMTTTWCHVGNPFQ